ncbi:hypothetical protein, partial [Pseudomonas sp. IT-P218]|uniref:hypothetical protein n=1 Tax=Pseudomonas sp. IT-P218 TaxID=3026449 RepID=UPI0039E053FE
EILWGCHRQQAGSHKNLGRPGNLQAVATSVGASLLAIASNQSPSMLTDMAPSPAGWLPHWFCSVLEIFAGKKNPRIFRYEDF